MVHPPCHYLLWWFYAHPMTLQLKYYAPHANSHLLRTATIPNICKTIHQHTSKFQNETSNDPNCKAKRSTCQRFHQLQNDTHFTIPSCKTSNITSSKTNIPITETQWTKPCGVTHLLSCLGVEVCVFAPELYRWVLRYTVEKHSKALFHSHNSKFKRTRAPYRNSQFRNFTFQRFKKKNAIHKNGATFRTRNSKTG